jgi:hypothetical protein
MLRAGPILEIAFDDIPAVTRIMPVIGADAVFLFAALILPALCYVLIAGYGWSTRNPA